MKKYGNLLLAIFTLTLLMQSCKTSDFNIAKRHYRSGYFISIGSKKHTKQQTASSQHEENIAADTSITEESNLKESQEIACSDKTYDLILSEPAPKKVIPTKQESESSGNSVFTDIFSVNSVFSFLGNSHKKTPSYKQYNQRKNNAVVPPRHNTGLILKIIGIIIACIGVAIFISAFPLAESGMVLGRSLLVLGILTWTVGAFL